MLSLLLSLDPTLLLGLGAIFGGGFLVLIRKFLGQRAVNKQYEKVGRAVATQAAIIKKQREDQLKKLEEKRQADQQKLEQRAEADKKLIPQMGPDEVLSLLESRAAELKDPS